MNDDRGMEVHLRLIAEAADEAVRDAHSAVRVKSEIEKIEPRQRRRLLDLFGRSVSSIGS